MRLEAVESGAVARGEALQLVESTGLLEGLRIEFEGGVRGEDARAAARGLLCAARVRR